MGRIQIQIIREKRYFCKSAVDVKENKFRTLSQIIHKVYSAWSKELNIKTKFNRRPKMEFKQV